MNMGDGAPRHMKKKGSKSLRNSFANRSNDLGIVSIMLNRNEQSILDLIQSLQIGRELTHIVVWQRRHYTNVHELSR